MQNAAISLARDLDLQAESAIERLLGRSLGDDEQVSVHTFRHHEAPEGEARVEAARRLEEHLDVMARKVKDVSQSEMESAIDEALAEVRPRRWQSMRVARDIDEALNRAFLHSLAKVLKVASEPA